MSSPLIIADDHPLFRSALRTALTRVAPEREVIEVQSLASLRESLAATQPGLVCLDLHMSDSDGFAGLIALRHDYPVMPIVVVSGSESAGVPQRARKFGASGFIPKSSDLDTISAAFGNILDGETWFPDPLGRGPGDDTDMAERLASLTPAQLRVLTGVHEGLLNKQIAYNMGISEATVKAHLTAIFRKLNVVTRTQAVLAAASLFVEDVEVRNEG